MANPILDLIAEVREDLVVRMQDSCTPKDVRSGGSKVGILSQHRTAIRGLQSKLDDRGKALLMAETAVENAEERMQALAWNSKKKAAEVLDTCIAILSDAETKADEEAKMTKQAPEVENTEQAEEVVLSEGDAVARLPEIEAEIADEMHKASKALLTIGARLNEAREEFSNAKEFLVWSEEKFGFKKAYVYRLMKVADEFGEDEVFNGLSIKVLNKIAAMPEEVKAQAREQVEQTGEMTGGQADALADANKPASEPAETSESTHVDNDSQGNTADFGHDEGAPWNPEPVNTDRPAEPLKLAEPEQSDEVKHLRELVSELQAELAAARQEREDKAAGRSKAPMLPQFNSECYYARLGLSAEQGGDSAEVRKAFRALVKAGYNSQHEAYQALLDAKESLMQVSEAA